MSFGSGMRRVAFVHELMSPWRATRGARLARTLLLAGGCCVLGVVVARLAISSYGTRAIELAIGVPLLIFLLPRPLLASLALLAVLSTVYPYAGLPHINLPGHPPLSLADVFLAAPVLGTVWRKPWRTWHPAVRRWFLVVALMLALVAIVSAPVATQGHAALRTSIVGFKNLAYLLFALTIALELSGRPWRPLLDGVIAIAAVVAIVSIAADAIPSLAHQLDSINATTVQTQTSSGGVNRIRLPGLFLVYGMMIPTLALVLTVKDRWRTARILALVLMVGAVAISLNRNMYFGALIGLIVTMLVGGPRLRHRILLTLVIIAATAVLVVESLKPSVSAEVTQRAGSALSTSVLSSGSAQDRALEFQFALRSISAHTWAGVGWMQFYGLTLSDLGATGNAGGSQRVYVEDWYLHLATDYGVPVAVVFLMSCGLLLGYGIVRARQAAKPADRAMIGACAGAVVAMLLSALVGTYLQSPDSMVAFGAICGLLLAASLRATRPSVGALPAVHGLPPYTSISGSESAALTRP